MLKTQITYCNAGSIYGSAGFGAWRELTAHIMTTNWALARKCSNFPLMYHWRILEAPSIPPMNGEQIKKLEDDFRYWDNSPAVRKRLEQIHNSSACVLLFLEYILHTPLPMAWVSAYFGRRKSNAGYFVC